MADAFKLTQSAPSLLKRVTVSRHFTPERALPSSDLTCPLCKGSGIYEEAHPETGREFVECEHCQGSGLNRTAMLLLGLLKAPLKTL